MDERPRQPLMRILEGRNFWIPLRKPYGSILWLLPWNAFIHEYILHNVICLIYVCYHVVHCHHDHHMMMIALKIQNLYGISIPKKRQQSQSYVYEAFHVKLKKGSGGNAIKIYIIVTYMTASSKTNLNRKTFKRVQNGFTSSHFSCFFQSSSQFILFKRFLPTL